MRRMAFAGRVAGATGSVLRPREPRPTIEGTGSEYRTRGTRRRPVILIALVASLLIPGAGPAEPTVVVTQPDESKFPEITVYFEVKNPDGSFLLDARREAFRVTEDGRDRPILRFDAPESTEVKPTTVVLVVDHSGSMKEGTRRWTP